MSSLFARPLLPAIRFNAVPTTLSLTNVRLRTSGSLAAAAAPTTAVGLGGQVRRAAARAAAVPADCGMVAQTQIPVSRGYWLLLGGGGGNVGYGYGELGLRVLLKGNGRAGSAFLTTTAGGAAGNGYGTCSAATCHASPYGPVSVVTPTWGTVAGCNACHTVPIASTGPNTGGHALHNDTNCVDCHNAGTTATQAPLTGHRDNDIDVANVGYPPNRTKHAAGSGYASCSAAICSPSPCKRRC